MLQHCFPHLMNKYNTEGVALPPPPNIQRLRNNHGKLKEKKNIFVFNLLLICFTKERICNIFSSKTYLQIYTKIQK